MRIKQSTCISVPLLSIPFYPPWVPVAPPGRADHGAEEAETCPSWVSSRDNLKIIDIQLWSSWSPSGSCPQEEAWPHHTCSIQNPSSKPFLCIRVCGAGRNMVEAREETQIQTHTCTHKHSSPHSQLDGRKHHLAGAIWGLYCFPLLLTS